MFTLNIETNNAAFDENSLTHELSRILKETACKIAAGKTNGNIYDINGNCIGSYSTNGTTESKIFQNTLKQNFIEDMKIYISDFAADQEAESKALQYLSEFQDVLFEDYQSHDSSESHDDIIEKIAVDILEDV